MAAIRGIRGLLANNKELETALRPLPQTAVELRQVGASFRGTQPDIFLGSDATEARLKKTKLDQYHILYFATHALVAGKLADFAKLNAEPALVLSRPNNPTEFDDGFLTASEVAQLKLIFYSTNLQVIERAA